MTRARPTPWNESGFTLIELLVAIAVVGIVSSAVATMFILGIRQADIATETSLRSRYAQVAASYFVGDVQSADDLAASSPCDPVGTTPTLVLRWVQGTQYQHYVSYALESGALVRRECDIRSTTPETRALHVITIASDILDVSTSCDGATCTTSGEPREVELTVDVDAYRERDAFTFVVTGVRRST